MYTTEGISSIVENIYSKNLVAFHDSDNCNVDIEKTIDEFGVIMDPEYSLSNDDFKIAQGYVRRDSETQKIHMWVNPAISSNNRKFIIAHELGHAVLHFKKGIYADSVFFRDSSFRYGQEEDEADEFALTLLMRESSLRRVIKEIPGDTVNMDTVAEKFEVQTALATFRAKSLGLIRER